MSTLVIAEHDNSNLKPSTLNTLAAANAIGGSVHLLVVGSSCQAVADACAAVDGVEKVLLADDAAYANQLAESTANLIKSVAADYSHILAPATTFGKNVLPRLSALLDVQQISRLQKLFLKIRLNDLFMQEAALQRLNLMTQQKSLRSERLHLIQ